MNKVMHKFFLLGICVFLLGVNNVCFAEMTNYFPDGVRLGMDGGTVQAVRPKVVKNSAFSAKFTNDSNDFALVEMVGSPNMRIAYWYYFKDDILRGISRTEAMQSGASIDADGSYSRMYQALRSDAQLIGRDKVLRSNGIESFELTAERWQDRRSVLNYYFLGSSSELTLIVFDPSYLKRDQFFLSPSMKEKFDKNGEKLKKSLEQNGTKVPKSETQVVDVPRPNEMAVSPIPATQSAKVPQSVLTTVSASSPSTNPASDKVFNHPVVFIAVLITVIVGATVFLLRRKSP